MICDDKPSEQFIGTIYQQRNTKLIINATEITLLKRITMFLFINFQMINVGITCNETFRRNLRYRKLSNVLKCSQKEHC